MSNKKILQGHNKALESLATIAGIPITKLPIEYGYVTLSERTFQIQVSHSVKNAKRAIIIPISLSNDIVTYDVMLYYATLDVFFPKYKIKQLWGMHYPQLQTGTLNITLTDTYCVFAGCSYGTEVRKFAVGTYMWLVIGE